MEGRDIFINNKLYLNGTIYVSGSISVWSFFVGHILSSVVAAFTCDSFPFLFRGFRFPAHHRSPERGLSLGCSTLVNPHDDQGGTNKKPEDTVRHDGSDCSRILPSQNVVENSPTSVWFVFRVTAIHMPNRVSFWASQDVYQTDFLMSYVPAPLPSLSLSPPIIFDHWYASKNHTLRENRPAAIRYSRQLEATMKYLILTNAPPLL